MNLKNILSQIGIGFVMFVGVVVAVIAVAIVWLATLVYSAIQWFVNLFDRPQKDPVTVMLDGYKNFKEIHPEYFKNSPATFTLTRKPRHNIRGRDGRFVKRSVPTTPANILAARSGVPIDIRLATNG